MTDSDDNILFNSDVNQIEKLFKSYQQEIEKCYKQHFNGEEKRGGYQPHLCIIIYIYLLYN